MKKTIVIYTVVLLSVCLLGCIREQKNELIKNESVHVDNITEKNDENKLSNNVKVEEDKDNNVSSEVINQKESEDIDEDLMGENENLETLDMGEGDEYELPIG